MKKYLSVCRKEMLLLLRDKAGLSMLFIMPVALIVISSLMQEFGWNSLSKDPSVQVLFVDNDRDSLGIKIKNGFIGSGSFKVIDSLANSPLTAITAREAVKKGDYLIAIVVPEAATRTMRSNVRLSVAKTLAGFGIGDPVLLNGIVFRDSVNVTIYFDPTVKTAFKNALISSVRENYYKIQTDWVFKTFNEEITLQMPMYKPPREAFNEVLRFSEEFPTYREVELIPNTTQHNVPAWTIFAMFFIVIPLTQSLIQEREGGSLFRLLTMPVSYMTLLMGKVGVYLVVCVVQTAAMLLAGVVLLPLFGLPMLVLGNDLPALLLMTLVVAMAAVGYGLMIGTIAKTHQQAAAFGSISVIILAAMGGLWVPIYLMPPFMKTFSLISPLNWAITGYYSIFVRGGSLWQIAPQALKLFLFFISTVLVTGIFHKYKHPLNI
ncbi:MAG: ABC transporter permease [Bacteroidales bacterium]|nr:ABC transporter permease [Bacteroidales bacterium]